MNTQTLRVDCTARPVRLAFLIDLPDPAILQEVFHVNSMLWGGMLNPVVIVDGSNRVKKGAQETFDTTTYDQELLNLLKEFDPDILIHYGDSALPGALKPFHNRTFGRDSLRWNPWGKQEMSFFLEVWPFLHKYWRQEFRFSKKPTPKFGYVDLSGSAGIAPYLVARFGAYPDSGNGARILKENFEAKQIVYDEEFRKAYVSGDWVFPISITSLELRVPVPNILGTHIFFLFDPLQTFDVVDFWNLRATGLRLFPLPVGHYQDFAASAKLFAERANYPINQQVMNRPEIVKGRSIDDSVLMDAGAWMQSLGVKDLSLRGWIPRFGDRGYRIAPQLEVRQVSSAKSSEVVLLNNGFGTLQAVNPECEFEGPAHSQHWALEVNVSGSTDTEHTFRLPWLHPECDQLANASLGHGFGPESARVSKQGVVVVQRGSHENVLIQEPKVTDVFKAYLVDAGFRYQKTSSAGLALERIVEQLGGLRQCAVFQNPVVRQIIDELANGSRIHSETVRSRLYRQFQDDNDEKQSKVENVLKTLVATKILRQGLELQCERCQRYDWYHLGELDEEFKCKKCFHRQLVPLLGKNPWHYVSDGLFRMEGKVAGALTTVLSLRFLGDALGHEMRYVPSFDYQTGSEAAERDFVILSSEFLHDDVEVIIGECKTAGDLDDKVKTDMKQLAESTGAYLAFSTLLNQFSETDKLFFKELVEWHQRPILLTQKHLEMPWIEISHYIHEQHPFYRQAELLSRLTVREALGKEFADTQGLYL